MSKQSKVRYAKLRADGVCTICGHAPAADGVTWCQKCCVTENERKQAWKKHILVESKNTGVCWICGSPVAAGRSTILCIKHLEGNSAACVRRSAKLKKEVMDHYGGKCACCGFSEIGALTIDHINGDGNKERRESGIVGGTFLYRWLREQDYPAGYQVLCSNCNTSKGMGSKCHIDHENKQPFLRWGPGGKLVLADLTNKGLNDGAQLPA